MSTSLVAIIFRLLVYLTSAALAADYAWNGHTTPGSRIPSSFTPFYVPPGAKSYDSASPLLHYSGRWTESFSAAYIHKTLRSTSHANASVTFTFSGTGIEWFGNVGDRHGIADVYVDGILTETVDTWNQVPRKQQRLFWKFDLRHGKHTLKIIHKGCSRKESRGFQVDLDALVVTAGLSRLNVENSHSYRSESGWTLVQKGSTGVHAMQLAIISQSHALVVDKVEHNPLTVNGHPAWGALYNLDTHSVKPLSMQSNSFCAGGSFISNGTMINVGGNPVVEDHTSAADFGDLNGLQAIRIFEPCHSASAEDCDFYENPSHLHMASPRWYNTVLRIADGSAMVIGGSKKGGWINNGTVNNPTIEYFPPKSIHDSDGSPIRSPFLVDTLNSNLFPIAFSLPDGNIFVAANNDAMIYNWKSNTERRLPKIPNGIRVTYPMTGTGLLLPLSPDTGYTPEILLCGGSDVDDTKASWKISSQNPATAQCSRMVLTEEGIANGWTVEQMPQARIMPDAVLLPTGEVVIVNGAGTGVSGYGNVLQQVGASNADNPVLSPVLYDPSAPFGERFSTDEMPVSDIPRMYHSVATLTPGGNVMIAGSNPNLDRSEVIYGTEYRVEWLGPPYMQKDRPSIIKGLPAKIGFGEVIRIRMSTTTPLRGKNVKVSLMDLGFVTHGVHANSRLVYLLAAISSDNELTVTGPPNGNVYPPGPGWIYVVVNGIPSAGVKVMVGSGEGPADDD